MTKLLQLIVDGFMSGEVQEFMVIKFLIEEKKLNESEEDFKERVKEGKRMLNESRDINKQINMYFEFQEFKDVVTDMQEQAAK